MVVDIFEISKNESTNSEDIRFWKIQLDNPAK